ncbi:helix-turn-helix domain-containing protein [Amycolatopsis sp. NPDC004368]
MLGSTNLPVAIISGRVGYQSESAFSRAFRAEVGTTPTRFRREQLQRRSSAGTREWGSKSRRAFLRARSKSRLTGRLPLKVCRGRPDPPPEPVCGDRPILEPPGT